jgi:hypothetical protein
MRTHVIAPTLLAGTAAVALGGCGEVSDFPTTPAAVVSQAPALPAITAPPTPTPTPTADPQIAQLRQIIEHDASVINASLEPFTQCEVLITDVGACRSALTGLKAELVPMLTELRGMHVSDDLQKPYGEMADALTTLIAGCDDDLRYLSTRNHADNEKATHELNRGVNLLDSAQWDLPSIFNSTTGGA